MTTDRDDELRAELKATGLRVTPTRLWVLRVLSAEPTPLSHADLVARLPWDVERTTVFRALVALTDAGLLHRVDVGDRVWRYTAIRPNESVPATSFVCTACGAVTELRDVSFAIRGAPRAVREGAVRVFVHGRCDSCA